MFQEGGEVNVHMSPVLVTDVGDRFFTLQSRQHAACNMLKRADIDGLRIVDSTMDPAKKFLVADVGERYSCK